MEPIKVKNQYGRYIYGTPYDEIVAAVDKACVELEIEGHLVEIERIDKNEDGVIISVRVHGL